MEALLDPKVAEPLAKVLAPFITLSIDEAMGKRIDQLTTMLKEVKTDNRRLSQRIDEMATENTQLKSTITEQSLRLDELENYSRSDNIIIRGLPEQSAAERATTA